jgi:hypothetical protein
MLWSIKVFKPKNNLENMGFWDDMRKNGEEFTSNIDRQKVELEEKKKYLLFFNISQLYRFCKELSIQEPEPNSVNPVTGERYSAEITSENFRNKLINEVTLQQILEFGRRYNIF